MWMVFIQDFLARVEKQETLAQQCSLGVSMSTAVQTAYFMEDPREAMRLELKVDPEAWVRKYLAHRVPPGALKFFVWGVGRESF